MFTTLSFNEMDNFQQANWLTDMFGESIFTVSYKPHWELSNKEKEQVNKYFFSILDKENATINQDIYKQDLSDPLASALRQYTIHNSELSQVTNTLNNYKDQKVTIIKFSDFGFPTVIHTNLFETINEKYAQYNESLRIVHKPKRKRSFYSNRILPKESILVYSGWVDIDQDILTNNIEQSNKMTVKQSKYNCFDNQYMQDVINTIQVKPLINYITAPF
ncbi:hypothetical protein V1503_19065 [Bacillus sp. SCS-151]|uniref:hypothetical protein n=1 Tax=Nanhaiella sioensis TaxID=3115293 RepID=UPI003979AFBD